MKEKGQGWREGVVKDVGGSLEVEEWGLQGARRWRAGGGDSRLLVLLQAAAVVAARP